MVVRCCGSRVSGGAYLTVATGRDGKPLDFFLIDAPMLVSPDLALSPIGVSLMEVNGTYHVLDIVGSESYPNVADFVEEARRYGISRRIPRTTDFGLLTKHSKLVVIHARAYIENADEYYGARPEDEFWCPRDLVPHQTPPVTEMCGSLWWEDVEGGTPASALGAPQGALCLSPMSHDIPGAHMHRRRSDPRSVVRALPEFSYRALRRPDGVSPQYRTAIFGRFPIGAIEVVKDTQTLSHLETERKASESEIRVEVVDE